MVEVAGWASRVEFVHDLSTAVTPSRRCAVIVSDLRGVVPLFGRHIPAIVDARTRWLAEGGTLIPRQDTIYAALIESPRSYERHFSGWLTDTDGLPFAAARRQCANRQRKVYLEEDELLSAPAAWLTLDYPTVTSSNYDDTVALDVARAGTGHGLALWFESTLVPGVELSNRPGRPQLIYGQLFLPWPEPVVLRAGDTVQLRLRARLIDQEYVWSWTSTISQQGASAPLTFNQSTFLGETWSPEYLARMDVRGQPALTARGRAATLVLHAMDGTTTTEAIAARITNEFPDDFPDTQHAVKFISSMPADFWR